MNSHDRRDYSPLLGAILIGALVFTALIIPVLAGSTNNVDFIAINPSGPGWPVHGNYVVGDWFSEGNGGNLTVSTVKAYLGYQGNAGDDPLIKVALYEAVVTVGYKWWFCDTGGSAVWAPGTQVLTSETLKTSMEMRASANPDLNVLRNNPGQARWVTFPVSLQTTTGMTQNPPPTQLDQACMTTGTQTVYNEYIVIDSDGYAWEVGFDPYAQPASSQCILDVNSNGVCANTISWSYNIWGASQWWQFDTPGYSNILMNIQTTYS